MAHTPTPVSAQPVQPAVDVHDRENLYNAKDAFYTQQLVRNKELAVLRDKMRWCYRREGVNYLQNCRELTLEYLAVLRGGFITHFKIAPDEGAAPSHE